MGAPARAGLRRPRGRRAPVPSGTRSPRRVRADLLQAEAREARVWSTSAPRRSSSRVASPQPRRPAPAADGRLVLIRAASPSRNVSGDDRTFPLIPRQRVAGPFFGAMRSGRRGIGFDVAGSRPYRPGDDMDTIDWSASAKLSSARASDEFVVRVNHADEAPCAVVICDYRPSMALFEPPLPWLDKAEAMRVASRLAALSVTRARGLVGYLDLAEEGDEVWERPRSRMEPWAADRQRPFRAPADSLTTAFRRLLEHRRAIPLRQLRLRPLRLSRLLPTKRR